MSRFRGLDQLLNHFLDRMVRPEFSFSGWSRNAFQVCGCIGLFLASMLSAALVANRALSSLMMMGIVSAAILTFLVLALLTKLITGTERLVYYHHQIAILAVVTILSWVFDEPTLAYLDVTILGLGAFMICGRIGCLMIGCCHGRPHNWGVSYRPEHASLGFPSCFVHVRLFPVQALESVWLFFIVTLGSVLVLNNRPAGEAFAWYVVSYALGRFCFEFLRGDERVYVLGFSESQWISLGFICFVVWTESAGLLPSHAWHLIAACLMAITMMATLLIKRYRRPIDDRLLSPGHVKSVAEAVEKLSATMNQITDFGQGIAHAKVPIAGTVLGIQISSSLVQSPAGVVYLYGLSSQIETITEDEARTLAGLILKLKHPGNPNELLAGSRGVFGLLVHPLVRTE